MPRAFYESLTILGQVLDDPNYLPAQDDGQTQRTQVAYFRVVVKQRHYTRDGTAKSDSNIYHCEARGWNADNAKDYVRKGDNIFVVGSIKPQFYQRPNSTQLALQVNLRVVSLRVVSSARDTVVDDEYDSITPSEKTFDLNNRVFDPTNIGNTAEDADIEITPAVVLIEDNDEDFEKEAPALELVTT
jgi:single-stranded DNA-binding protein